MQMVCPKKKQTNAHAHTSQTTRLHLRIAQPVTTRHWLTRRKHRMPVCRVCWIEFTILSFSGVFHSLTKNRTRPTHSGQGAIVPLRATEMSPHTGASASGAVTNHKSIEYPRVSPGATTNTALKRTSKYVAVDNLISGEHTELVSRAYWASLTVFSLTSGFPKQNHQSQSLHEYERDVFTAYLIETCGRW